VRSQETAELCLLNAVICLVSSVDQKKVFFSTIHNGKMNFTENKSTGGPP
jgi:hypothetical protein